MIQPGQGWVVKDKDGKERFFPNLEGAQESELHSLFGEMVSIHPADLAARVAETILANKDRVLDILTTTKGSRPKARRVNGGTKRRNKGPETPALPNI